MGMASDVQQTPFVKQLAANDKPTRDKALASLQTYLTSTHQFTELELLKIWKGLFFCMFHTSSPLPQQRLSRTLSSLLLSLPEPLFLPFLSAFYATLTSHYAQLPSLRLDKYLHLLRRYVSASFTYLLRRNAPPTLVRGYLDLVAGDNGPLSCGQGVQARVPDGIRYHVLDFWVPELRAVVVREREEDARLLEQQDKRDLLGDIFMEPVSALEKSAKAKPLRKRAREVLQEWKDASGHVLSDAAAAAAAAAAERDGSELISTTDNKPPTTAAIPPPPTDSLSDKEWDGFGA